MQRAFQDEPAVVDDGVKENIVYRSHDHNFFCCGCHLTHNAGDCRYNTCAEDQPFLFDGPFMACFPPVLIGVIPFIFDQSITKYSVLCSFYNGFCYLRSCLKIHISHPHRQFFFCYIPFHGASMPAVCFFVKYAHFFFLSVSVRAFMLPALYPAFPQLWDR